MATLRKIATIDWRKEKEEVRERLREKELRYTLIPGETKKNYCKIMFNIRLFETKPVTLAFIKRRLLISAGVRQSHTYSRSGQVRVERKNISSEQADEIIANMKRDGYLIFVTKKYADKLNPNIPEGGLSYYTFDQYKIIECQESKFIQAKIRRSEEKSEKKGKLETKRCRALRQIYAQFGYKTPFTYNMVVSIPKFYKKIIEEPEKYKQIVGEDRELTPELKYYYRKASEYAEARDIDFMDTWNSLIRNNYLIPYKVRTKDGTVKVRQGAYLVNMEYARRCLSSSTDI